MTKARRKMEADIKLVDAVIELRDARCPRATENPDLKKMIGNRQRLILLNKADLADSTVTKAWIEHFRETGIKAVSIDSRGRDSIDRVRKALDELTEAKRQRESARGITGKRAVKAMICGIPNVGKSTFINSMAGKASAKTGNKPGVTKGNQWININNDMLLLDTPGVLWPRFDDEETALCLAEIGSVNDQIINLEELSVRLIDRLLSDYRQALFDRYSITQEEFEEKTAEQDSRILGISASALAVLDIISFRRGCIKKGAEPDYSRSSRLLIDEFRSGRLGRISLQKP